MSYPYVQGVDKFKEFWAKLGSTGIPPKIDTNYLKSLGFTSSNDRKFPQVLRFLDLIDDSSAPTDVYRPVFREGDQGKAVLAKLVRENYADLFSMYPDAHRKDTEAIQNFFRARTDVGDKAVQTMTATFRTVCSLADFDKEPSAAAKVPEETNGAKPEGADEKVHKGAVSKTTQPLTINVNIQLEIPATSEADVYDNLFSSMAKHILRLSKE